MDKGLINRVIFIGLKLVFDLVNRTQLPAKLKRFGKKETPPKWFKTYLYLKQVCKMNNCMSNAVQNNCGVPQYSILGLLLFNFYLNSLLNYQKTTKAPTFLVRGKIFRNV